MSQWPVRSILAAGAVAGMIALASLPLAGQEGGRGGRNARPAVPGGPVPRTPDGKPDLRGKWEAPPLFNSNIIEEHPAGFGIQAGKSLVVDPADGKLPYQPWALAQRDVNRRPENAYLDNEGRCIMSGVPRIMLFTFEVAYAPGYIVLVYDYVHHTRAIPMDGRAHLPNGIRLWMGDPVGRWEGDTLVVDSTNFNGKPWMALGGDFISDAAHMVERFTLTDSNTLSWQATIDDPKAYTRPFTMQTAAPFTRSESDEMIEDSCHEGNADLLHLKNMYDAAQKAKTGTQNQK
jgi:hypothetical protein